MFVFVSSKTLEMLDGTNSAVLERCDHDNSVAWRQMLTFAHRLGLRSQLSCAHKNVRWSLRASRDLAPLDDDDDGVSLDFGFADDCRSRSTRREILCGGNSAASVAFASMKAMWRNGAAPLLRLNVLRLDEDDNAVAYSTLYGREQLAQYISRAEMLAAERSRHGVAPWRALEKKMRSAVVPGYSATRRANA